MLKQVRPLGHPHPNPHLVDWIFGCMLLIEFTLKHPCTEWALVFPTLRDLEFNAENQNADLINIIKILFKSAFSHAGTCTIKNIKYPLLKCNLRFSTMKSLSRGQYDGCRISLSGSESGPIRPRNPFCQMSGVLER